MRLTPGAPLLPGLRWPGPLLPLLVALVASLSSCAVLPPTVAAAHNYAGRFSLAVTYPDVPAAAEVPDPVPGRSNAWSGRFSLAVAPAGLVLDLVSPLGATIARFETDQHGARLLVAADGGVRVERGADAQALSERVLGWSLPVAGLPDWVEGRPAGERPYRILPAESGSERFEQDGWAVTVEQAVADRPGRRLQMERGARDGSPAVALRVVLDGPGA